MATIQSVTGPISSDDLGPTLAHEHLLVGYAGWEADTMRPGPSRADVLAICKDKIAEMSDHGVRSMIDPCPADLGRDVELMAEVSVRSGFRIICATGLYKEDLGGAPYWRFRASLGGSADAIAELYIHELTIGIGETGVKAGIIKVATSAPQISDYERMLLEAAATASKETGAPITTHTEDGVLGDQQQQILTDLGVPAHRIIIGHCCGSDDFDYHSGILNRGSYIGFDRFGIEILQPDETRIASLLRLIEAGHESQIVISHDSVWCWRGQPIPDPVALATMLETWTPAHFFERIIPRLKDVGVSDAQISTMLEDNPRRFFAGDRLEG